MTKDKNGKKVQVGSKVKVTNIDHKFISSLPKEEQSDVASMLNEIFEIYEIDQYGQAWVEKQWVRGEDQIESHSLALSPFDMELITNKNS